MYARIFTYFLILFDRMQIYTHCIPEEHCPTPLAQAPRKLSPGIGSGHRTVSVDINVARYEKLISMCELEYIT